MTKRLLCASMVLLAACSPAMSGDDGGPTDDAGSADSGVRDAGLDDAGAADAGVPDAGVSDAGTFDGGGVVDGGANDGGTNDGGATDAGATDAGPCLACTSTAPLTYTLPSPAGVTVWTTTTMDKVLLDTPPPAITAPTIDVLAAKNEFEPFQLVLQAPARAQVTLAMTPFTGPGMISTIEIRRVGYVNAPPMDVASLDSGTIPDTLTLTSFGTSEGLSIALNQPFWITVQVPKTAVAGDYTSTLTVMAGASSQNITVNLHVFNFAIPDAINFDGHWEVGQSGTLTDSQSFKDFLFAHRVIPDTVAWPAAYAAYDYDCVGHVFDEQPGNAYDISTLGPKYIDGVGWNGIGFQSFQAGQGPTRPDPFCGVAVGADPKGTPAYNVQWALMLTALNTSLTTHGWLSKSYLWAADEPLNQADYDLAASFANLSKSAAPNLRIAITEQPRPEIAENPLAGGHSYDLWWAPLRDFDASYAKTRQALGETVWWYAYNESPPFFSPLVVNRPGIESRVQYWAAFANRVRGLYVYDATPLMDVTAGPANASPTIRLELMREGEEDFEYLRLAAGGTIPLTADLPAICDETARGGAFSPKAFTHDAAALKHLRDALGEYLEGKRTVCPVLTRNNPGMHPRAEYYLNFQDPNGEPSADPLVVNGHTWTKVGPDGYSPTTGAGWYSIAPLVPFYQAPDPTDDVTRSGLYDDYEFFSTFNWDLENGRYTVTVSIGYFSANTYPNNRIVVEGQTLIDGFSITPAQRHIVQSIDVDIVDGSLTIEMGTGNDFAFINWVSIVPN